VLREADLHAVGLTQEDTEAVTHTEGVEESVAQAVTEEESVPDVQTVVETEAERDMLVLGVDERVIRADFEPDPHEDADAQEEEDALSVESAVKVLRTVEVVLSVFEAKGDLETLWQELDETDTELLLHALELTVKVALTL
jgi:hypothetical protein